jgi:hypothetical protein
MMARSKKLQSKAGYIDARPLTASSAKPLATRGRTIHSGQSRYFDCAPITSGLPDQRTSSNRPGWSVSCHEETHAPHNLTGYSITSSARPPLFWRQIILQMLVEPVNSKLDRLAARLIVNPIVFNAGNHDQLLRSYRAFIGALRIGFV